MITEIDGVKLVQMENGNIEDVPANVISFCNKMMQLYNLNSSVTIFYCEIRKTPKYWKLFRREVWKSTMQASSHGSVMGGVCVNTLDIYKSASAVAMAKGVRGNCNSELNGQEALTYNGYIRYLK